MDKEVLVVTANGLGIRFKEKDVDRTDGRGSMGCMGIRLAPGDNIIDYLEVDPLDMILFVSENGYGKVTEVSKFRLQSRGGKGITAMRMSDRNGKLAVATKLQDHTLLTTKDGILILMSKKHIPVKGRNTQGCRLVHLGEGDSIVK